MVIALEDVPFPFTHPHAYYDSRCKTFFYRGDHLPSDLSAYRSHDFSYARWQEDDLNHQVLLPLRDDVTFSLRPHQKTAARRIVNAYRQGWRGFLEADETGLGKTLSTLGGVTVAAREAGYTPASRGTLLVVCPKSVIPHWRQTLRRFPAATALVRPMVINYQQLGKLLTTPKAATKAKRRRTKNRATARQGTPTVAWDFIIFDEAHMLKNYPTSTVSLMGATLGRLDSPYVKGKSPFVVFSTATPGASPLNLALMSGFLAPLLSKSDTSHVGPASWGPFLQRHGFAVTHTKSGWSWAPMPWKTQGGDDRTYERKCDDVRQRQRRDSLAIGRALTRPEAPFIKRSPRDIAGWPQQQVIPYPVAMDRSQQTLYEELWSRFRQWLRMVPARRDPKGALVEMLRYRQKSSLLKVASMSDQIIDLVHTGHQVFVSCEFTETVDAYEKAMSGAHISWTEISGRIGGDDRECNRIAFQRGEAQVVLCTVVSGVSLHAGETLPDGSTATQADRITILHDVRQNNLDSTQALGRAHRDGKASTVYVPYLESTVDEKVISSFCVKTSNMKAMSGDSAHDAEELEHVFRNAARH